MDDTQKVVQTGAICGLASTLLYLAIAVADQFLWPETKTTQQFLSVMGTPKYGHLNMAMHFALVGALLLWIVGFVGLYRLLGWEKPRLAVTLGALFGILGCALMVAMSIVQGSVMVKAGQTYLSAGNDAQQEAAVALYRGLRDIDLGLDLAFDTFFFTGWICLAWAMLRHRSFGKVFGTIGILLFAVDTPLQLWYAPDPPPFDIGPLGAFWFLAVYIQMIRVARTLPAAAG